mmetsp:Transcript_113461/g.178474  ORF Transcript_113461/g.178474 Transcript_113461/m.178474 type:complete len:625 (+) Transcript_113461:113-1987(+)
MIPCLSRYGLFTCFLDYIIVRTVAEHAVWSAGPPGPCTRTRGDQKMGVSTRSLQCVDAFTANVLSDASCATEKEQPCRLISCNCKKMQCVLDATATWAAKPAQVPKDCHKKVSGSWKRNPPSKSIGYLGVNQNFGSVDTELYFGDQSLPSTCFAPCGTTCHSGFPFFYSSMHSAAACAKYCFSYGLDLAGFVVNVEQRSACRCGATAVNKAVLHDRTRGCLELDSSGLQKVVPTGEANVIQVLRYSGYYVDDGIPEKIASRANDLENRYIDSVVTGKSDELAPVEEFLDVPTIIDPSVGAGWTRQCFPYPNQCAGVGPRQTMTAQITQEKPDFDADEEPSFRFNKYVVIRYMFLSDVDDTRKDVFREAAAMWNVASCISFVEDGDLSDRSSYELEVRKADDGCSATLGMPGVHKNLNPASGYIKLGWCNEMRYVGNVAHEIGHVLGMNHKQARPDGSASYYGKGPFLQLNWDNIPSSWQPFWQADESAYIGSASDGAGDIQTTYADYDFDSIMHYSVPSTYGSTIPAGHATGNRKYLSEGDVKQIMDMYNCYIVEGSLPVWTTTTTTTIAVEDPIIGVVPQSVNGSTGSDLGVIGRSVHNACSVVVLSIIFLTSPLTCLGKWSL